MEGGLRLWFTGRTASLLLLDNRGPSFWHPGGPSEDDGELPAKEVDDFQELRIRGVSLDSDGSSYCPWLSEDGSVILSDGVVISPSIVRSVLHHGREQVYNPKLKTRYALEEKLRASGLSPEAGPEELAAKTYWMSPAEIQFFYPCPPDDPSVDSVRHVSREELVQRTDHWKRTGRNQLLDEE